MTEDYFVYAQKVGTKSFGGKPFHFYAVDGIVKLYHKAYEGMEVKTAITKLVKELQDSGAYSRIMIRDDIKARGMGKTLYDWHMDGNRLDAQEKDRTEYLRKRNELKAQIAELKAQIAKLDEEWYS